MVGFDVLSFLGGIHPPYHKENTQAKPIEKLEPPGVVVIPLQQHIGASCDPVVKVGDVIKKGQKIGESRGFVGAPIHSSVSGIVKSITMSPHPTLGQGMAIIVENDGLDQLDDSIRGNDLDSLPPKEIVDIIRESGIVGMGGAAFPTHVKLSPPSDKEIDTIILNGAECEPYLTTDHRLMVEHADHIIYGLRAIMKVLGVKNAYIGIEDNKPDAIEAIKKVARRYKNIHVKVLKTKYPQGAEKQLIEAIIGRQVPSAGLPMDVGVVVNNVATAAAISNAIKDGMPLIERVITVTGKGVSEPKNLLVPIGTPFSYIIDKCGGTRGTLKKVISGGPMMGLAQYTLDVPVVKGTSGILLLTSEEVQTSKEQNCIRCAKCVEVCPINLMPLMLSAYSKNQDYESCERLNVLDCIECGSCSYICPARKPLMQNIRIAKREAISRRKKQTKRH